MPENFMARLRYNGKLLKASVLPQARKDGMYYEINIPGFPRFYMNWTAMDKYDLSAGQDVSIPYDLLLLVSDAIEEKLR